MLHDCCPPEGITESWAGHSLNNLERVLRWLTCTDRHDAHAEIKKIVFISLPLARRLLSNELVQRETNSFSWNFNVPRYAIALIYADVESDLLCNWLDFQLKLKSKMFSNQLATVSDNASCIKAKRINIP